MNGYITVQRQNVITDHYFCVFYGESLNVVAASRRIVYISLAIFGPHNNNTDSEIDYSSDTGVFRRMMRIT